MAKANPAGTLLRGHGVVRFFLGGLLLIAAALKLHQLATSSVAGPGLLDARWLLMLSVAWEILLGMWMLSGLAPDWSWAAATGCFLLFAGVSAYKGFSGQMSCGCLGRVVVHPWRTFVFDCSAVVALLTSRYRWGGAERILGQPAVGLGSWIAWLAQSVTIGLVMLGVVLGVLEARYGTIKAAVLAWRGGTLVVAPSQLDLGCGSPRERRLVQLVVTNTGRETAKLEGGNASCSCAIVSQLPVEVPPGESVQLDAGVAFPDSEPGEFSRFLVVYTDQADQSVLGVKISGNVSEERSGPRQQ